MAPVLTTEGMDLPHADGRANASSEQTSPAATSILPTLSFLWSKFHFGF